MSKEKDAVNDSWMLIIPLIVIVIVNDYLYMNSYFGYNPHPIIIKGSMKAHGMIRIIKLSYLIFIALAAYVNVKVAQKEKDTMAYYLMAIVSSLLFIYGALPGLPVYQQIGYPVVWIAASIFTYKSMSYVSRGKDLDDGKTIFPKTENKNTGFTFDTKSGPLHLNKPEYGIYFEAGAGGGKSVLIKDMLRQSCEKGYAGVLYDFEGDCTEPGGAELTRTILTSLKKYNQGPKPFGKVSFAYLNFADPTRTVRVNPLSPKYIKSTLDLNEFATTLMTNLEPDWLKKKDFWAGNAINYTYGILVRLYNDPALHKYMTIPHLVAICTKDYEGVFNWILEDKSLERRMMPIYVAWKEDAKSQLAGAVSSAALPITRLLEPEIFWPLSPQSEDETFDLDITNEHHPVFFSVGTVPKNKYALGPVCSLVLLICMNNMNQFGKRRSLFVVDELPTIFIPNLDNLPATARKKGVTTVLSVQSFKQLEYAYSPEKAKITRDNLSNQFIGKTRNDETAKHIINFFGKKDITKESMSTSDSGESYSYQTQKENKLEIDDVLNQPIGHWTGVLADGTPPYFHLQFGYNEPPLDDIPVFARRWQTGEDALDHRLAKTDVLENYNRVLKEIDDLIAPYESKSEQELLEG